MAREKRKEQIRQNSPILVNIREIATQEFWTFILKPIAVMWSVVTGAMIGVVLGLWSPSGQISYVNCFILALLFTMVEFLRRSQLYRLIRDDLDGDVEFDDMLVQYVLKMIFIPMGLLLVFIRYMLNVEFDLGYFLLLLIALGYLSGKTEFTRYTQYLQAFKSKEIQ